MRHYYSASTGGFYSDALHGARRPADVIELSDEDYRALIVGQSAGRVIAVDASGCPVLVDPPTSNIADAAAAIRRERDMRMMAFAWRYDRYGRETRLGKTPTDDLAALDEYMRALADIPAQPGFPLDVDWPTAPGSAF